jgi:N-methylhydantoinase A/oxoprolinase/acetone carboxylase beta subunit
MKDFASQEARVRVGADVGGTFTDIVMVDDAGTVDKHKMLSTPPHYEFAVLQGISHLLQRRAGKPDSIVEVTHGTTVATNAVLESRGARTAMITTRGFRDVLELRRVRAPQMYNLFFKKPKELVERRLRFEVTERISAEGEILVAIEEAELPELAETLKRERIESIAVCFLHSYAYPQHEIQIGEYLRKHLPGVEVTLSSEILRERREYERSATAAVNAYVRPVMKKYVDAMSSGLQKMGVRAPLLIMQSTGGLTPDHDAAERPVYVLESGPAAGVLASLVRAQIAGVSNAITFDMGGTTAKASLIEDQQINYCFEYEVGASLSAGNVLVGGGGELIRAPSIDIAEVGAGGGSIAFVDVAGRLCVGPKSAGAVPGPVCYGRGGTEPTVTDANVAPGYIRSGELADGHIRIDLEAAQRAIQDRIAQPLGISLLAAAEGIYRIANAQILRALRAVSTQRGRDPRQFVLIAFGGSGPIHAAPLARELSAQRILIPPLPGLFSAVGLLSSYVEHHDVRSCFLSGDRIEANTIVDICRELSDNMLARFQYSGTTVAEVTLQYSADVRFRGQSWEIRVPIFDPQSNPALVAELRSRFFADYERLYGHTAGPGDPIEVVAIRIVGRVVRPQKVAFRSADPLSASHSHRMACFDGRFFETPVVSRNSLEKPQEGPLLIDEYDSTTVVPPGMRARLDEHQNILLEVSDGQDRYAAD